MIGKEPPKVLSNGLVLPARLCQFTFQTFNRFFQGQVDKGKTHKEAYRIVENAHEVYFGEGKYASYQSFRQVRNKYLKREKGCK